MEIAVIVLFFVLVPLVRFVGWVFGQPERTQLQKMHEEHWKADADSWNRMENDR